MELILFPMVTTATHLLPSLPVLSSARPPDFLLVASWPNCNNTAGSKLIPWISMWKSALCCIEALLFLSLFFLSELRNGTSVSVNRSDYSRSLKAMKYFCVVPVPALQAGAFGINRCYFVLRWDRLVGLQTTHRCVMVSLKRYALVIEQLIAIVELMYFSLTLPATLIKLCLSLCICCLLVRGALFPPLLPKGLANPPFIPESYSPLAPASVLLRLAIPGESLICLSLLDSVELLSHLRWRGRAPVNHLDMNRRSKMAI